MSSQFDDLGLGIFLVNRDLCRKHFCHEQDDHEVNLNY